MENMNTKWIFTTTILLLLLARSTNAQLSVLNVEQYGARADGNSDVSQALLSAWKDACASTIASRVFIPGGVYGLAPVILVGPCKAPINLHIEGTLMASVDPTLFKSDSWIQINYVDQLSISGTGTLDGRGSVAWNRNDCAKNFRCSNLPYSLRLNFVTNSLVRDITSKDSKMFHMMALGAKNLTFQHVTISAPGDSINTDGIHIGRSNGVNVIDTNIQTGDDCVSIGDGCQQINIERVHCGPGHGISVGSLGRYKDEKPVSGIFVRNCTITGTMFGVRIKSWPSSPQPGTASDMHFEDIIMNDVGNPILIDQEYCPSNQCNLKDPSSLKISNASFKNIRGTSSTQLAVKLDCSKSNPCDNVEIVDINLTYNGTEGPATSQCSNVQPRISGIQVPSLCTAPVEQLS